MDRLGVIYLHQVMDTSGVRSFQELSPTFGLPNSMFFRFLQLRESLNCQFGDRTPDLTPIDLLGVLHGSNPRQLTSVCYASLLTPAASNLAFGLKTRWVVDVGELENEKGPGVLASCKLILPKL